MQAGGLEGNTAQYPVNQWIVAGEPVVAKDYQACSIERGYIESNCLSFSGGELDREIHFLHNSSISGSIEKFQRNWRNWGCS
jgi:hypothetical protein